MINYNRLGKSLTTTSTVATEGLSHPQNNFLFEAFAGETEAFSKIDLPTSKV